jgi:hypothetical protein
VKSDVELDILRRLLVPSEPFIKYDLACPKRGAVVENSDFAVTCA